MQQKRLVEAAQAWRDSAEQTIADLRESVQQKDDGLVTMPEEAGQKDDAVARLQEAHRHEVQDLQGQHNADRDGWFRHIGELEEVANI